MNGLFEGGWERVGERLDRVLRGLIDEGYEHFLCGMAEGFDMLAGERVVALRREYPRIKLTAVIPYPEQPRAFDPPTRARYDALLAAADETVTIRSHYTPDCFRARNDFLIAGSSVLVCYYNGTRGGTHYTVRRAWENKIKIVNTEF